MVKKNKILSALITVFIATSLITGCSKVNTNSMNKIKEDLGQKVEEVKTKTKENTNTEKPSNSNEVKSTIQLEKVTIVKHVDGDTTKVKLSNGKEVYVRFIGVNTPETVKKDSPVEPYGKEASEFTHSKLKEGASVWISKDAGDTDKYGRLLRYVWLAQPKNDSEQEIRGKMLNAILLSDGYAQVMTIQPNVKYQTLFVKLQREARESNKGLWSIEPYRSKK
jgi:micrococcal nuclease